MAFGSESQEIIWLDEMCVVFLKNLVVSVLIQ